MEEKYILAKITIPIKLGENNEIEPLAEYMKMNIEECDEPLVKEENNVPVDEILKILQSKMKIEKEENTEIILTVEPSEIKKRIKGGYQHTFKNRKSLHNKTCNHQKIKISLVEQDADET